MNDLQIHLAFADRAPIGAEWNTRDIRSTFWRFYINSRDGAAIWYAGGKYLLPAGRIHLIPAYLKFSCQNTARLQNLYVHFDLLGITPILQQQLFPKPISLPLTATARRLCRLFEAGRLPQSCPVSLCLTHATLLHSMGETIEALPAAARERLQSAFALPDPLSAALGLVEQRLPQPVSVQEMANACHFSPDYFARKFFHLMGQTPARYVLQRRIGLTARKLLYGLDSIETIAQRHGFANRFHFTRAFRREMGTTPAAYRKSPRV